MSDLALAYHLRWEIEITFKEIKVQLLPAKQGGAQTPLRSHLPELVRQEVYAFLGGDNLIRDLIAEAAVEHDLSPLDISFVDTLELVRATAPMFAVAPNSEIKTLGQQLRLAVASFANRRPRIGRCCPRRVKRKMSKWHIKRPCHRESRVDFAREIKLVSIFQDFAP